MEWMTGEIRLSKERTCTCVTHAFWRMYAEYVICDFGLDRHIVVFFECFSRIGIWFWMLKFGLSHHLVRRIRFVMYIILHTRHILCVVLLLDPLALMLCASWKGCEAVKDVLCIFISVGVFIYCCSTIRRSIDEVCRIKCAIVLQKKDRSGGPCHACTFSWSCQRHSGRGE